MPPSDAAAVAAASGSRTEHEEQGWRVVAL